MASVVPLRLLKNNDMSLELDSVADARTLSALNSGVSTITLTTLTGTEISGQAWPTLIEYVSGSSGTYRGILGNDLTVTAGQKLLALVTFSAGGSGGYAEWEFDVIVRKRRSRS